VNKSELWDELRGWLIKATAEMYKLAETPQRGHMIVPIEELKRKENKARGMDLVLKKMQELEKELLR
jgi:hypothetical protein